MNPPRDFEVVVAGGGPAGTAAAIAAARQGMKTCLLERHDVLGGMGTAGLVNNFCNAHHDGRRFIIGGLFAEIRQELIERGALFATGGLEPFNHEVYCEILKRACADSGVEVRLGHTIREVGFRDGGALFSLNGDPEPLRARFAVDATGDGAVCAAAGVPFTMGGHGGVMPLTFCYILGPFDRERLAAGLPNSFIKDQAGRSFAYLGGQPELVEWVREAKQKGEVTIPRDRIAVAYAIPGADDHLAVNFGRVVIEDPTDPAQLAAAEEAGRAQAREGEAFFRKYVPGFEKASVVEYARQIGVRESRQICGQYTLTGQDVLDCRQFEDVIAQCCYSIDIHDPKSGGTTLIGIPQGCHYDIPLRCLIPAEGPPGLAVAGRCISATQEAMSSLRVSPSAMAIGEAAGVLASLAVRNRQPCAAVPFKEVQRLLLENGAILE